MFQEFPKCLISGESSRIVFDKDEEKAARADGFMFHSDEPKKPVEPAEHKKPGRKPKAD